MSVARQSPCKINLLLNVIAKRDDGFHELETLMHPIRLHDELEFSETAGGIMIDCNHPDLPTDSSNLIYRAAESFLSRANIDSGVFIRHQKNLPIAAGLAGGSANAAHTLRGLNELFGEPLAQSDLDEIAAQHGSDINFFLQDGPAIATGRGESVESLEPFPALANAGLVLINPGFGIPTPWAFKQLARYPEAITGSPGKIRQLADALSTETFGAAADFFFNSLEAPVLPKYPALTEYRDFFTANGAHVSMMSGSGATTFAITESPAAADEVAARARHRYGQKPWIRSLSLA